MRCLIFVFALLLSLPAYAGNAPQPPDGMLAQPKYEALRYARIKMHTGPGKQYPVSWVYLRKALPVKVVATYDVWRKIVDPDGTTGWVQETMLSDKRTVVVAPGKQRTLHHDPADTAATVALAEPGAIAQVQSCAANWCHLTFADYDGWMQQADVWGTAAGENFDIKK
jgi:SH3-like domain-containing protein